MTDRTPAERHQRHLDGQCPDCPDQALWHDIDGILYCPVCFWSED